MPNESAAYSWFPDRSQSGHRFPERALVRPVEAGIALLQRKRLVAEKQLVVLLMAMEIVESTCLVEDEREPAPAVVLGVG